MHYNGVLDPHRYVYGSVVHFDRVDDRNQQNDRATNDRLEVLPNIVLCTREGIHDGLRPLEGEADIVAFNLTAAEALSEEVN